MLHAQACGVQNIRSLVSTVLLTLKRYKLADHILFDTPPVNDPTWDRMETVVLSCIFDMITGELQYITKEHGVATHQIWRTIEHQFIDNSETRVLHLDTTFRNSRLSSLRLDRPSSALHSHHPCANPDSTANVRRPAATGRDRARVPDLSVRWIISIGGGSDSRDPTTNEQVVAP
jgi:hypothetical protein